jgi:hypothetical protein
VLDYEYVKVQGEVITVHCNNPICGHTIGATLKSLDAPLGVWDCPQCHWPIFTGQELYPELYFS